jgi:hypothetical protein
MAAPTAFSDCARKLPSQGPDPDKGFGNIELVLAEPIGRESTQDVRSILKYCLAYKRLPERIEAKARQKAAE